MVKNNNIKRISISKNINSIIGIPSSLANKILDETIKIIKSGLIINKSLKIKNFGTFKLIKKKSRMGRNPITKEKFEIKKRNVITFKASIKLKNKINKNV